MRSHRWRSVQSGLPESAHGSPELVKHALLVEECQVMTGCDSVIATCVHFAKLFQERRGLREMNRQINVIDCQPDVLLLALPNIENKLAQES